MVYQFALNYNQTSFTNFPVQPKTEGISWPSNAEEYGGDALIYYDGGQEADLLFGFLTKSQYNNLLSVLDLLNNDSRAITIRLPDNGLRIFRSYNAIIKKPNSPNEGKYDNGVWRDVVFKVYNIRRI